MFSVPAGADVPRLASARILAAYGEPDAAELAAADAFGPARNQAFADSNKRTAHVVAELLLSRNGIDLTATGSDGVLTFLALASGDLSEVALTVRFRANSVG